MKITGSYNIQKDHWAAHDPAGDRWTGLCSGSKTRGFTLVEVAAALMMMLILSGTLVTLLSQHVFFVQMVNNSSFLSEEAPRINALVSNIVNQADSYFIFASFADAQAAPGTTAPVLAGGRAVRLTFRNPAGGTDESILSYAGGGLNYHYKRAGVWSATPDWVVTSQPTAVDFTNSLGLLEINFTGPKGEVITFAGSSE